MEEIDISVIVLTCNRSERCRDSLKKNQAELASFRTEWWLINNGTETVELPPAPPAPTRLIQMPRNGGTAARNAVLGKASGSCLLMIDDDAYINRASIQSAFNQLQEHPEAGGVILSVQNEGCLLSTIFHGCAVLFSTAALEAAGGYPTDYLYYGEEYEVSFRLASAGYLMLQAEPDLPEAVHVRDSQGRDTNHILYRLVRNNTCCWARSLPFRHLGGALYDTLYRYHHVATKEQARAGFRRGVRSLPRALLRGLFSRHALNEENYGEISLNTALEQVARQIKKEDHPRIVLCGFGKFPSGWIRILKIHGLEIIGILEQNSAFHGRHFRGIPIHSPEALNKLTDPQNYFITGISSRPANTDWENRLTKHGQTSPLEMGSLKVWRRE